MTTKTYEQRISKIAQVQKKYGWDCFKTFEYDSNSGKYSHPTIQLFRRMGIDLEYTTDLISMEFQRTKVKENNYDDPDAVYGGHIDLPIEYDKPKKIAHLIDHICEKREELRLITKNMFQDFVTALFALGFQQIEHRPDGSFYIIS